MSISESDHIEIPLHDSAAVAAPSAGNGDVPLLALKDFPYIPQEKTNWCWAACALMTFQFKGNAATQYVTQHDLAQWFFQNGGYGSAPCTDPTLNCTIGGNGTDSVGYIYQNAHTGLDVPAINYGYYSGHLEPLWFEHEFSQIGLPIEIWWEFTDTRSAHVLLAVGTMIQKGTQYVLVHNPLCTWRGPAYVSYEYLLDAGGLGTWVYSWAG